MVNEMQRFVETTHDVQEALECATGPKRTLWDPYEDETLLELVSIHGLDWNAVSVTMRRSKDAVRQRHRRIINRPCEVPGTKVLARRGRGKYVFLPTAWARGRDRHAYAERGGEDRGGELGEDDLGRVGGHEGEGDGAHGGGP